MNEPDDKPKKLGELLVGAGLVPEERLSEGLEYARRHSLPLGRVLITQKLLTEEDLESVLHSQALMKMDHLPARLAVKAIAMAASNHMSIDRALKKLGWFSEKYVEGEAISVAISREQVANCESSFGPDHPETAAACLKLAELLTDNRSYLDAELLYNRAAKIVEDCFGHQSLEMANLLSQMGAHYFAQDRFDEAEKHYWQSYEIKLTLLGDRNLAVAECLEDLAELYDVQSEYIQAERLYLSSIGIKEKIPLNADDPEMLSSLRKLVLICRQSDYGPQNKPTGELLVDAGLLDSSKIDEGLRLSQKYNIPLGKALITLKQLSQEDLQRVMHAQLLMKDGGVPGYIVTRALKAACSMNCSVAEALRKLGWKPDHPADQKHLELLLRCSDELIKLEQQLTPEHPEVAEKCIELADLYAGANNLREAEILLKRALNIYLEHIGEDEPATADTLCGLAQVHCRQNRFEEANNLMERAVNLVRKRSPKSASQLAHFLETQARILHASSKHRDALPKASELVALIRCIERADTAPVSQALELEGDIYAGLGQWEQAFSSYELSMKIREKVLIGSNPQVIGLLNKIAEVKMKQERYDDALIYLKKALELSHKLLGATHPLSALAEINMAICHGCKKEPKKASECFERAIQSMEQSAGEFAEDTVSVLQQYSAFLKSVGQEEEAKAIDERIAKIRLNVDARQTAINLKAIHG